MPVVAKETYRVAGFRQLVRAGKVYEDNDPVVVARPDLFESPESHQRRKARPQSTADLGERSMSARRRPVETARSAPGEGQPVAFPCPNRDTHQCDRTFGSAAAAKTHASKAHA